MENNLNRYILRLLALVLLTVLTGCANNLRPNYPAVLDPDGAPSKYPVADFNKDATDYRTALAAGNISEATAIRDRIVFRAKSEIQGNYNQFKLKFFENRASFDTFADWTELMLAGATTITIGERSKTVLGAVLTAAKGGRLSVEKNWFREKTTESLLSAMQAERDGKWAIITKKLNGDAKAYGFDEAWGDLVDLFYAGTLESALSSIAAKTGNAAEVSKGEKKEAETERANRISLTSATKEEIETVEKLTDELGKLADENATDREANRARARAILKAYGKSIADGVDPFQALSDEIITLEPGSEKLKALSRAFQTK